MEIRILYKAVGKPWQEASIDNTLGAMQATVGGYIETARISKDAVVVCNEEGLIRGLPYNCRVMGTDFVGDIFVVGTKGEEFVDVPVSLADWQKYWIGGGHE